MLKLNYEKKEVFGDYYISGFVLGGAFGDRDFVSARFFNAFGFFYIFV